MLLVEVCINLPVKQISHTFTYRLPDGCPARTGWRVQAPFGGKLVEGFVLRCYEGVYPGDDLKYIDRAIEDTPWFDGNMLKLAQWLSDYYLCSLAEAMRLFLPGKKSLTAKGFYSLNRAVDKSGLAGQEIPLVELLEKGQADKRKITDALGAFPEAAIKSLMAKGLLSYSQSVASIFRKKLLPAAQLTAEGDRLLVSDLKCPAARQRALFLLRQNPGGLLLAELRRQGVSGGVVKRMAQNGLVILTEKAVARNSYAHMATQAAPVVLNEEQQAAFARIKESVEQAANDIFLLYGVTGSGKTEIYLNIAQAAYQHGRQVLVLVPEIALTGQIIQRFQERFSDTVLVCHSRLSLNERMDVFSLVKTGAPCVLIGTRSALFAPFAALGAVIMDEEHEYSYKQEERPCYHARAVAAELARLHDAPLVLGSATPSLESYYKSRRGEYTMLSLSKRPHDLPLPKVALVDMKRELAAGNRGVLSGLLVAEVKAMAARSEQGIVLLNRRGFATFVLCRDCGYVERCGHCAVSLVYHQAGGVLRCHYCGYSKPAPVTCPACQSRRIRFFGSGTQKAQTQLAETLPAIRVVRMDQDTTGGKLAHEKILGAFRRQEYDLLLGTQMVAKGHDIANVTLVGIIAADAMINLPDFRSGERTFAILAQAAGRAGRGQQQGRVIMQAYETGHAVIGYARRHDYYGFAEYELQERAALFYPPYSDIIKIRVINKSQDECTRKAGEITDALTGTVLPEGERLEVNGPFPGIIEKVQDIYNMLIIIKTSRPDLLKKRLTELALPQRKDVSIDIDPINVI